MIQNFNRFNLKAVDTEVRENALELLKVDYSLKSEDYDARPGDIKKTLARKKSANNWFKGKKPTFLENNTHNKSPKKN